MKNHGPITKGGVHPSTHAANKLHDPGHHGTEETKALPTSAPHLHEKKIVAHKSGKYGEAKTNMAGHAETKTVGSTAKEQAGGKSPADILYPKKRGLRGVMVD